MKIPFVKMNGTGNDFLLIDNRRGTMNGLDRPKFVRKVCRRRESIGADGVIILEISSRADFSWDFYNADGSVAEMCGNGARCAARFAHRKRIAGKEMRFETLSGIVGAKVDGPSVRVNLTDSAGFVKKASLVDRGERFSLSFVNTGVPHAVMVVEDLDGVQVEEVGRRIRNHRRFKPEGTNVDFIKVEGDTLSIRTYERGVEGETLACGTGAVASAIVGVHLGLVRPPVVVGVRSRDYLTVYFEPVPAGARKIILEGGTSFVCEGFIREEAVN